MDWGDDSQKHVALALFVELLISIAARVIKAVSLIEALFLFVFLVGVTLLLYFVPQIVYRIRSAARALLGKQPDPELATVGIRSGVESSRGAKYSPSSCMERADRKLDFMGILGSKWVEKPDNFNKLESLLQKIEQDGEQVRFLLANWDSDGYGKLLERRNREDMSLVRRADHYRDYLQLAREYDCFEVRLYSQIPTFRMVFIDDQELGISRYRYNPPTGEFDRGRRIPHIVVDKNAQFSMYYPFEWTFEEIWCDSETEQIGTEHIPLSIEDTG